MTATATATALRTYQIDPAHSEVTFQVRHLLTKVRGRFSSFSGAIEFDSEEPQRSSVTVAIDATSVDTSQPDRDTHLRSADFFSVAEFPQLTFVSTRIVPRGADAYDVVGLLTIRGVSHEIVLPAQVLGTAKDPWGQQRLGFEAEITLNRKDYGLHWNAALEIGGFLVGDEVKVSLSIQAVGQ
jgi:polyisoprenoid-binding protein YceI